MRWRVAVMMGASACYTRAASFDYEVNSTHADRSIPLGQQRELAAAAEGDDLVATSGTVTLCRPAGYDDRTVQHTEYRTLASVALVLFILPGFGIPLLFVPMSKTKTRTDHQETVGWEPGAPSACGDPSPAAGRALEVTACWADAPCRSDRQVTDANGRVRWVGWGRTIGGIARFCGPARVTVHDVSSDGEPRRELDLSQPPPAGTNRPDGKAGAILPSADATLEVPSTDVPLDALDAVARSCHDETFARCEATVATSALPTCTASCRASLLPECAKRQAQCQSIALPDESDDLCGSVGEKCVAATPIDPARLGGCVQACTRDEQAKECR